MTVFKMTSILLAGCLFISTSACQQPNDDKSSDTVDSNESINAPQLTQSKSTAPNFETSSETDASNNLASHSNDNARVDELNTVSDSEDAVELLSTGDEKDAVMSESMVSQPIEPTNEESIDPSNTADNSNTAKALLEKQITKVSYRNKDGGTVQVIYQTSAYETLEADVTLPSGKRTLLFAPRGQGNNPTYRSKEGSIELITHGGGGSIELIVNGQTLSYDAVSADAEVVSPS